MCALLPAVERSTAIPGMKWSTVLSAPSIGMRVTADQATPSVEVLMVMSTSTDGVAWSAVTRIPIDGADSTVDHFIPGIAVDRSTAGSSAHIGLTYYFYPKAQCGPNNCELAVGYVS